MDTPYHIPALLNDCLNGLEIKPEGIYVDVTLGGAGHSRAILERLGPEGRLLSFDQDIEAIKRAQGLRGDDQRWTLVHSNFRWLGNFLRYHGVQGQVDGLLADLGVSFHHFDDPARGFTFREPSAPLDMRMNPESDLTAAKFLNEAAPETLAETLRLYGELPNAGKLARAIIAARPLRTAGDLTAAATPLLNPARQKKELACVFQAVRIAVNDEMGALRELLTQTLRALKPGGILAVITYHSLEDRLVKNFMKAGNLEGKVEQDFYGRRLTPFKLLTPKPIVPTAEEVEANPRSRSAKLRIARLTAGEEARK